MTRPKRWHVYLFILALILIVFCCHRKSVREEYFLTLHFQKSMLPAIVICSDEQVIRVDRDGKVTRPRK
jgi:uncharacterized integral membrane protein